jgi:hypothetical protein
VPRLAQRQTHCSRESQRSMRLKFTGLSGVHRTIRCAPDYPVSQQRSRQRPAARSTCNQWATCGQSQWSLGSTGQCPVCQVDLGFNGRLRQRRKEIMHCSCPVRQRTEGKNCLPNGDPTASNCLGAIKGTPRRMEQYTKPPLNILRRLNSASTHPDHRV